MSASYNFNVLLEKATLFGKQVVMSKALADEDEECDEYVDDPTLSPEENARRRTEYEEECRRRATLWPWACCCGMLWPLIIIGVIMTCGISGVCSPPAPPPTAPPGNETSGGGTVTPAPTPEPCPNYLCELPFNSMFISGCTPSGVCMNLSCLLVGGSSCDACDGENGASCDCPQCTCEVRADQASPIESLACVPDCCPEDPYAFYGSPYSSASPTLCGNYDYNCDDVEDEYPCCDGLVEPAVVDGERMLYNVTLCAEANAGEPLTDDPLLVCGACSESTIYPGWTCEEPFARRRKRALLPCPDGCSEVVSPTASAPPNISQCALFTDHCVPPHGGDGERCCIVVGH